jgi:hypothetical protein
MNVWNKILLGLIGVASLAFFYFGTRALKVHKTYRDRIEKVAGAGGEIEKLTGQKQTILDEISLLDSELDRLTAGRGRVWFQCQPIRDKIDTTNGSVSLVSKEAGPHLTPTGAQVFVFQDPLYDPQGKMVPGSGFYLGEFAVTKIDKNAWDLQPSKGMTEQWLAKQRVDRLAAVLTRLQANQPATWTVYEVFPKESVFAIAAGAAAEVPTPSAKLPQPEAQAPAWPPPAGLGAQELIDHCKTVVDYHARKSPGSEKRADYEIAFNEMYRELTARADSINRAAQELKTVGEDQAEADNLEAALVREKMPLLVEVGRHPQQQDEEMKLGRRTMVQQRQDAEDLCKRLDQQQRKLNADIDQTLKGNQALAAEIARAQLEGLRRIQEQTEKMAQVSGGR